MPQISFYNVIFLLYHIYLYCLMGTTLETTLVQRNNTRNDTVTSHFCRFIFLCEWHIETIGHLIFRFSEIRMTFSQKNVFDLRWHPFSNVTSSCSLSNSISWSKYYWSIGSPNWSIYCIWIVFACPVVLKKQRLKHEKFAKWAVVRYAISVLQCEFVKYSAWRHDCHEDSRERRGSRNCSLRTDWLQSQSSKISFIMFE